MAVMQKMNIATGESNEISLLDANGGVLRELIEREALPLNSPLPHRLTEATWQHRWA